MIFYHTFKLNKLGLKSASSHKYLNDKIKINIIIMLGSLNDFIEVKTAPLQFKLLEEEDEIT